MTNLLNCPYCRGPIADDGSHAGQIVACPHCRQSIQLPHGPAYLTGIPTPSLPRVYDYPATNFSRQYGPRQTDIAAVICFASGLLSLMILPILLVPVCYITNFVSYYRLRDNPQLKGNGLRITGMIFGLISLLYLFWIFELPPFNHK